LVFWYAMLQRGGEDRRGDEDGRDREETGNAPIRNFPHSGSATGMGGRQEHVRRA
jgi:hypothetical protein